MKRVSVSSEVAANGCNRNLLIDKINLDFTLAAGLPIDVWRGVLEGRDFVMIGTDSNFNNNYT